MLAVSGLSGSRLVAWLAAIALAAVAGWVYRTSGPGTDLIAALWPAVHLLLAATGSLASPLVALGWLWVAGAGYLKPPFAVHAAALAALAVPLVHWLTVPAWTGSGTLQWLMGCAAGLAAATLPRQMRKPAPEPDSPATDEVPRTTVADGDVVGTVLELIRAATDAHEATLWRMSPDGRSADLRARAAIPRMEAPDEVVDLDGHPFRWAIEEQLPQHLQRGRRDLPVPWAAEMLLVPVGLPRGVLALAYTGLVPPGAETTALVAGRHLDALVALLKTRAESTREQSRVRVMLDAVRMLPGEIRLEAFARQMAELVRQGLGADGAAMALWEPDAERGTLQHVAPVAEGAPRAGLAFGPGESRMALAARAAVELSYRDLRRERDVLPLLAPQEMWVHPPRSAVLVPLVADGRALGVVAAWHREPNRFGERDLELLRELCGIAPPPLRGGLHLETLDRKASTDPLTGLANRAAFQEKLAQQAGYFQRYNRPFSLLVIDVDFFKKFNDTYGHEAGDRVLQHVADLLRITVRDIDLPARLGGEEFVVLLPETGVRQAAEAGERVRRTIEVRSLVWNGKPLRITVSVGAAACPDCGAEPAELLRLADEALYRAKDAGRNRVLTAPRAGSGAPAEP